MKRKISMLAASAAAVLCLTGCFSEENDNPSHVMDIGSYRQGVFTSDGGYRYRVTENNVGDRLSDKDRVILYFDVLEETEAGRQYDIRVTELIDVTCKNAVKSNEEDIDPETGEPLGEDAIILSSGWFSGGYLNIEAAVFRKKSGSTLRQVNLEYRGVQNDTVRLAMRHNAFGETPVGEDGTIREDNGFEIATSFYSVPSDWMLPSGTDSFPVSIESTWYVADELGKVSFKKIYTKGSIIRSGTGSPSMTIGVIGQ